MYINDLSRPISVLHTDQLNELVDVGQKIGQSITTICKDERLQTNNDLDVLGKLLLEFPTCCQCNDVTIHILLGRRTTLKIE